MPVIYSGNDELIDRTGFGFRVPSDESSIQIHEVVTFLNKLYQNPVINREIREQTEAVCDMKVVMKPVLDFFCMERSKGEGKEEL